MDEQWFRAAEAGKTEVILELLRQGADIDAVSESLGESALILAVKHRNFELIQVLLDRGASLKPETSMGYSSITYAFIIANDSNFRWTPPSPDPLPLEILIAAGGQLGLREAVLSNDVELARLRLDEGASVDTGGFMYDGPLLMIAAELGHIEIVNLLLDRGANIELPDDCNKATLQAAAQYGQLEVVRCLLDRGAEIDAGIGSGHSALSYAAYEGHHDVVALLLARGAQRGLVDAVALNDETLVEELLRDVADVDSAFQVGPRLAMQAVSRGNSRMTCLLLNNGAVHLHAWQLLDDDGTVFSHRWLDEHSLLAEAARHGHIQLVHLLIDRGADLHAVGKDGLTPLAWAIREGQGEVIRILKAAGAIC
jgi:uncharacterized protein